MYTGCDEYDKDYYDSFVGIGSSHGIAFKLIVGSLMTIVGSTIYLNGLELYESNGLYLIWLIFVVVWTTVGSI